ncbi:D-tyrosyl-tRNA(Tyr) deacylase [Hazenella sp. IB182357]|uniref:D-aminoacyl-tRNA deacylase n=1 Tax=Polycladospora coralii TaxID=2771432 RepID=A0A926N8Y8_9BACL|nr:D-aminoacyl-tRNA deacylase [Polycladospora coralii]MBD1371035.1 D-tyrosyl-tRNA(Tyr) deacylase [Polycladospora coralii]
MKVVLQRVKEAKVSVHQEIVGSIGPGFLLLVGITETDTLHQVRFLSEKIAHLRVFEDENQKMNHSILDVGGSILSVSQFTLYGDCQKGRRPNFMRAARPEQALPLYEQFNESLRSLSIPVETGQFGAMMEVSLINDGPVTLILEKD